MTTRTEQADDDGENREIQTMNSRTIDPGARPGVVRPATGDASSVGLRATFRDSRDPLDADLSRLGVALSRDGALVT